MFVYDPPGGLAIADLLALASPAAAAISDAAWTTLAKRLDEKQLLELPVLVGQFTNVAFFQHVLRLRLESPNPGLRAR